MQYLFELKAIFLQVTAPVLIIDADQQGDEIIMGKQSGTGNGGSQLVSGPAGAGDDLGCVEIFACLAEKLDGLVGIAIIKRDSFTDGVGVPKCQIRAHALR